MYRVLQPFREALSHELKASLFPAAAGIDPSKQLETYLDRLICPSYRFQELDTL